MLSIYCHLVIAGHTQFAPMKEVSDCSSLFNFSDLSKFFVYSSFFNNLSMDVIIDFSSSFEIFSLLS